MFRHSKSDNIFLTEKGAAIYNAALDTVKKRDMRPHIEKGILLGFSGGADSVLLLLFLNEYRKRERLAFKIVCVHVNHGIRGDEANRDEDFSRAFCKEYADEFISLYRDIPTYSEEIGVGIEEAARNARYSVFGEIMQSRDDIGTIAVAHNATDNAETVIFNMIRGAGISGMCGIKPVRDNIIRPLISISKADIISALNESHVSYVTDSTNFSNDYTRNYIRNEILPALTKISADPVRSILRMTENLTEDMSFIDGEAKAVLDNITNNEIPARVLRSLHPSVFARVITKLIFEHTNCYPEEKHIALLKELVNQSNFAISLPGEFDFVCQRDVCIFKSKKEKNIVSEIIFPLESGENRIIGTNLTVFIGDVEETSSNVYNFSIQAYVSSDIIKRGLILRFKKEGDAYKYAGVTHKLKKVFNDRDIPPYQRSLIPILCDSEGIVFVPGLSVRDNAKGDDKSSLIKISFCYASVAEGEQETFTALKRL